MKRYNLAFAGFGNVARALVELLHEKTNDLRENHGIEWQITGIATRGMGRLASREGLDPERLQSYEFRSGKLLQGADIDEWLRETQADVVLETTTLNLWTGQPAIDHLRAALRYGAHAISANKGPVLHAYQELRDLAASRGKSFLFESTVMDCLPVFSLFRECLPTANILSFRGILNSTTGVIIEEIEKGSTFEEGVKKARAIGITEADPGYDLDGWDAAVKLCVIARVLMDLPLELGEVRVKGIRGVKPEDARLARSEGRPIKLVSRIARNTSGEFRASVEPEQVIPPDPLANVSGSSLLGHFELDVLPGLTVTSYQPGLKSTAYGMLADFINAVRYEVETPGI